jgi:hypothetical protein
MVLKKANAVESGELRWRPMCPKNAQNDNEMFARDISPREGFELVYS